MKTPKGSVAIENSRNRLRLRWSKERYCLALGLPHNNINFKVAQKIASQIELDILAGHFDPTLDKYRTNFTPIKTRKSSTITLSSKYLLSVWDKWVSSLELSQRTRNGHYETIRKHIEKANPDPHNEHDFGVIRFYDERYFFKIDYYDSDFKYQSNDPASPNACRRIMTILRSDEY